ncbi:acyl carrier protein [Winogradskya humida]|uniref:Carrier domain-containing protein n=1 Tax=Winogradskya humida TaxID=113566 RepID=A0ABQ3ZX81_9ACTN|nr:phosphopantetheine-binding protein [Actinoplanes humidus]GIE23048.1 hypothetical protein Ahu01nite_061500 [Actinoplanes humidus]
MHDEIRDFVLTTIRDTLNLPVPGDVTDDTPLGDNGLGLESLSRLELAIQLEGAYGISLPDEEDETRQDTTLGQFVAAVAALRGEAVTDGAGR